MEKELEILKQNRVNILKIIENLTLAQINKTPKGFNNNIAWNITHLVVTHQLLCYDKANLTTKVNDDMISDYKKGTKSQRDITQEEFENIRGLFVSLIDKFKEDYNNKIFKNYNSYTTSADVTLNSIEDAISFNNFHEGIHLGSIFALRKLV